MQIDADRFREDFEALAAIGATSTGGVSRPTFSDAHLSARAWFLERARSYGLEARVDAAGNHSALLPGDGPTLLLGSHLDSVPDGGRYDGALGVVAALQVLVALRHERLPCSVEAIDFTDEEGTLVGLLGSEALAGSLSAASLAAPRGGREALETGLARAGLNEERLGDARRHPGSLAGYLELHIEQGPRLEHAGAQIGVVTGIVGSRSYSLGFRGAARHAGTTPMDARSDAGLAAAAFVVAANELVVRNFRGCVATVGDLRLAPGAFNVVPGSAQLALEFRSLEPDRLDALEAALLDQARQEATTHAVGLEIREVGRWEATPLDPRVQDAVRRAADALGLAAVELPSGAGHDAQALAPVTPSGMIFVPSAGGISHDAGEHTPWEDCVNGANVLLGAALELVAAGRSQAATDRSGA